MVWEELAAVAEDRVFRPRHSLILSFPLHSVGVGLRPALGMKK